MPPNAPVSVMLLNGTFTGSEGPVGADRIGDISVVSPAGRTRLDAAAALTPGDTTRLALRTGAPGTYVVGVSTKPRRINLAGADFNQYLALDGIPDVLIQRAAKKQLDQPATERYSKHVKAILRVGDAHTDGFGAVLGYPAELVPLDNPYHARPGSELAFRALVDGAPAAHQLVLAGGQRPNGDTIEERSARTGADGVVRFTLEAPGRWYVKFIRMAPATGEFDYESKWATLTFELR